jgi:outer membrane protein assembly factor BamB
MIKPKPRFSCSYVVSADFVLCLTLLLIHLKVAAAPPVTVLWWVPLGGPTISSPALAPDGTIYIGTGGQSAPTGGAGPTSRRFFSLTPQGTTNWVFFAGSGMPASPAIGPDATVYIGSMDGKLYSLAPSDGHTNWALSLRGQVLTSPAIGPEGEIYAGAVSNNYNRLYSLKPDGTTNWIVDLGAVQILNLESAQFPSPCIGPDGTIYVGSVSSNLYAISPSGHTNWVFPLGAPTYDSPSIGADGTIYMGSDHNIFYALDPDGIPKWSYASANIIESSAAVAADGSVYFGDLSRLVALDAAGHYRWAVSGVISASPAVAADGSVIFASVSGLVYAYSAAGTPLWSYNPGPNIFSSPVIATNGTIYIVSSSALYALSGTNAPANSVWPLFRRNPLHTARSTQCAISSPEILPSAAGVNLTMNVETGRVYTIQATTDLVSWIDLTNFVSASSRATIPDPDAPIFAHRFYRLRTP